MTTSIFFGAAGSGRTESLIAAARAAAAERSDVVRVVTASAAQCADFERRCAADPVIVVRTFEQICTDTLEAASGRKAAHLPNGARSFLMEDAVAQSELVHYAPLRRMPGFTQALLRLRFELHVAGVDTADLRSVSAEPRLHELALVLDAYEALLVAGGWFDSVRAARAAVAALDAAPTLLRGWSWLALDGFEEFTVPQREWLRRVAPRVGECVVSLIGWDDDFPGQMPRLARVRGELARVLGTAARALPRSHASALSDLGDAVVRGDRQARESLRGRVSLLEAPDPAAEVRAALRWIKARHLRQHTPLDRMALIARDMSPYSLAVRSVAAEMGIPIAPAAGESLSSNPAVAALLSLIRETVPTGAAGLPSLAPRPLIDAWRSPYFSRLRSKFGIASADAFALDMAARRGHVVGGRVQWNEALSSGEAATTPDPDRADSSETADRAQLRTHFDAFVSHLTPPAGAALRGFVEWVLAIVDDLSIVSHDGEPDEFADRDGAALELFREVLAGLLWVDANLGRREGVAPFELLSRAVAGADFNPYDGAAALRVLDVTQAGGLRFDAVAVLGLAEGRFPASVREDAFLRDADRVALNRRRDARLSISTTGVERDWFYVAATRADDAVLFTRPRLADGGVDWQASPFWDELCGIVPDALRKLTSADKPSVSEAASMFELVQVAAAGAGPILSGWFDRHAPHVLAQIDAGARLVTARSDGGAAPADGDLSTLADALALRFGPQHAWSASALEEYRSCPHRFFFGRALGLQPRPAVQIGPDTAVLGLLYHTLFERAYREAANPADAAAVHASLERAADEVFDAAHGFRAAPWWPQTRRDILSNVRASIDALADERWVPSYFEMEFRALSVQADGEQLLLRGRIDRADRGPGGALRVIDYKPGSPAGYGAADLVDGRRVQLPFYAHAAAQMIPETRIVDAYHFHYLHAEAGRFRLSKFEGGLDGALDAAAQAAVSAVRKVRRGEFAPLPPNEGCPEYCPAAGFCWSYTR